MAASASPSAYPGPGFGGPPEPRPKAWPDVLARPGRGPVFGPADRPADSVGRL